MAEKKGLVMIYTGDGKGKTTAALGLALRASGHGAKIFMVQFRKSDPTYGEIQAINKFLPNATVVQSERSRITGHGGFEQEDFDDAKNVFAKGREALLSGEYDLVIFDEVNFAADYGLIPRDEVVKMLKQRPPQTDVVLTGRNAPAEFVEMADLVSEVREIKHHYRAGIMAQKGIEY
ncbi:cob(I)yrinic acid a,c-diamide adenosyltransferase [Dethiobacter alkaliphilus]|uniref:cob(I)yrinic acid a,c-diamide adenosyltransferase n=1 Tax=Dethiobacter alkaliphilus TaxID=427926 RepID=UPI0022277C41|nr:cob(I)yrinic acid a,c-diamide adenosyltransferase [Dethiobacter alkaliphilus]MCW3489771.1 cob(I)yrinic acid a,c-diamide adenosyltransferase [Dethiobacter alkaliphilus]